MKVVQLSYPTQLDAHLAGEEYALALGFFDGVHRGHQAVISEAKRQAIANGKKLAVMTFDPHPSLVLGQRKEKIFYITTLQQKVEILEQMDVDTLFVVRFTSDFAKLSPEQFVDKFVRDLHVKHVIAGFDYTFGSKGAGTMSEMNELCGDDITVTVIEKQSEEAEKISSTRIRQALQAGDMELAKTLLGRPYRVPGVVVHGDKRGGAQIGFPTANIEAPEGTFIPGVGVYVVKIRVQDEWYGGMCNIGYVPTFKDSAEKVLTIEVNIFEFDKSIYGEEVVIDFYHRLRNEQKFNGLDALIAQLTQDKVDSIAYLKRK